MGQALYRSHRPKKLSEVVGQEHIATALARALEKGIISHAYLFTGPRGVGKTSVARILAHEINGLPYTDDANHLDIIEIDAASNRRIDEIRELRDKIHSAPTSAKYKVYIIDEVHMLTKEAFNALLKTLEEPPAHAVFILATTEAHKLPETIISRTQRFAFRPVAVDSVVSHLKQIAKEEKISVDDDALRAIAAHGEGSFRDSISLLDQLRGGGEDITLPTVQRTLGIAPTELVADLHNSLLSRNLGALINTLKRFQDQGFEAVGLAKQLSHVLKDDIISGHSGLAKDTSLKLLADLVDVPASVDPWASLEIALIDVALDGAASQSKPGKLVAPAVVKVESIQLEEKIEAAPSPKPRKRDQTISDQPLDKSIWPEFLDLLKKKHNTLYSFVRAAEPSFEPGRVILGSGFSFHQRSLNQSRNKSALAEILHTLTGQNVEVSSVLLAGKTRPLPSPGEDDESGAAEANTEVNKADHKAVKDISNIFGGAELIE